MKKQERMRITVTRDEITVIRKMAGTARASCVSCGGHQVEMATLEQAVTLTGIPSRTIYGWVEGGDVHFIETTDGHLLVCLESLRAVQADAAGPHQESVLPGESLPPTEAGE